METLTIVGLAWATWAAIVVAVRLSGKVDWSGRIVVVTIVAAPLVVIILSAIGAAWWASRLVLALRRRG